jgi:hypothetical protein
MTENRPLVVVAVVATVVVMAALVGAVALRVEHDRARLAPATNTRNTTPASVAARCSGGPCQSLASVRAADATVELMADPYGRDGRLRFTGRTGTSIFETDVSGADVVLTHQSLACVAGPVPACLVSGAYSQGDKRPGHLGEVFTQHDGYWSRTGSNYFYASAGTLGLVAGSDEPRVIAVQDSCGAGVEPTSCTHPVLYVQVLSIDGTTVGCTLTAAQPGLLPGKGTSLPPPYDVHGCPKSAG